MFLISRIGTRIGILDAIGQCHEQEQSIGGMNLRGHIFKVYRVGLPVECYLRCEEEVTCQSYNVVVGQNICELNDRTKEATPEDFIPDKRRFYMKRSGNRERFIMEYSSDQLNNFRICYVAFNLIPKELGKSSDKNKISATKKTWENGKIRQGMVRIFYRNESKKSHKKNAHYLSTLQNGKTEEWDCSYLFFALLLSDSIGSTVSTAMIKDIDDLRQVNNIAHSGEATITDTKVQNNAGRVLNALNSLSLPISDIITIKKSEKFSYSRSQQPEGKGCKFSKQSYKFGMNKWNV
ncbi:hypothetical protein AWC38_SpisGene21603 [Stylophora pistillata]|uniref:Apple domain-containing protein n=1 Tax=Stylophora pistillata TaxID=50429 RepID=A0A2B4RAT8_STYPI|nr:hypothetical protein AWC38_SpisGene21603 [Stylophora pistillata]